MEEESWIGMRARVLTSLLLLMMIILISSGGVDANPDVDALLAFKKSLTANGALSSWTEGSSSPCGWKGVNCTEGVLKTLVLYSSGLEGTLSPSLGSLTSLEVLELSDNKLSGPIPPEIGNMASLQDLRLGINSLTGVPPPEMNKLSKLKILLLNDNPFEGCLPASAWSDLLHHLDTFDISNTNLKASPKCN